MADRQRCGPKCHGRLKWPDSLSDSECYLKCIVNLMDLWSTFTGDRYIHKVNEQKPGCRNTTSFSKKKSDQHSDFRVVAHKMCRLDD